MSVGLPPRLEGKNADTIRPEPAISRKKAAFPTAVGLLEPWSFVLLTLCLVAKMGYFNYQIGLPWGPRLGGLVTMLGFYGVLISLLVALARRYRRLAELALAIVGTLIVHANLLNQRHVGDFLSVAQVPQLLDSQNLFASIMSLAAAGDAWLYLDWPVWVALLIIGGAKSVRWVSVGAVVAASLLMLGLRHPIWAPLSSIAAYSPVSLLDFGVIHYQAQDLWNAAIERPSVEIASFSKMAEFVVRQSTNRKAVNEFSGICKNCNLVLIQIESLQSFALDQTVGGRPVTPTLNRLAKRGLHFVNFYPQTHRGRTSDAEFAALNGLFPDAKDISYWKFRNNAFEALPSALKRNGYSTVAMHAYSGAYYHRRVIYGRFGFERTYFAEDFPGTRIGWGTADADFLAEATSKLAQLPRPFFSMIITLSSHHPYEGRYPTKEPLPLGGASVLDRYLKAVHYTDEALGDFLAVLKKKGLLSNTVVALYGDHEGVPLESWNELRQRLGWPDTPVARVKGRRVPFIVSLPEGPPKRVFVPGGQIDVSATLLNLIGISAPALTTLGHDLLSRETNRVVFPEGSWLDSEHLYLAAGGGSLGPKAFRLDDGDAIETSAVAGKNARAAEELVISAAILEAGRRARAGLGGATPH